MNQSIFFCFCLLIGLFVNISAEPVVNISQSDEMVLVGHQFLYYEDTSNNKLSIDSVRSLPLNSFKQIPSAHSLSFGFQENPYWFYINCNYSGRSPQQVVVVLDYSLVDDVRLYALGSGDVWEEHISNTQRKSPVPYFIVTLKPGNNKMYLRIQTEGTLRLPLVFYDVRAYIASNWRHFALNGVYLGAILLLALINLMFFSVYRVQNGWSSLFLVLFIGCYVIFQSLQSGFANLFPYREIFFSFRLYVISGTAGLISLSLFMIASIHNEKPLWIVRSLFFLFWTASFLLIFFVFVLPPKLYVRLFAILGALSLVPNFSLLFAQSNENTYFRTWFIGIYLLLLSGIGIFGLRGFGLLPSNWITLNSIPLSVFIFIFALTLLQFKLLLQTKKQKDQMEERWKELYLASQKFVPQGFLSILGKDSIRDVKLGDSSNSELTMLFADIRNFTSIVEQLRADESFEYLNTYYEIIGPIIRRHDGFIDKYMGDGIMAVFPLCPDDALAAALEMQAAIVALSESYVARSWPELKTGIGIHTGSCMIGTIGEDLRMDTTVISDAVNTAARLEGLTKVFGTTIMISEAVVQALQNPADIQLRFLGKVLVKGKSQTIAAFQVISKAEQGDLVAYHEAFRNFEQGMFSFFQKDMKRALFYFKKALDQKPNDKPTQVYFHQAWNLYKSGIPSNWDGYIKVG